MESASGDSPVQTRRGAFATSGRADKPGGADGGTGAANNSRRPRARSRQHQIALGGRVDADRPEGGDVAGSICRDVTTIADSGAGPLEFLVGLAPLPGPL